MVSLLLFKKNNYNFMNMESPNLLNNNVVTIKTDKNLATNEEVKAKNYRIRNTNWYCACCGKSQFIVISLNYNQLLITKLKQRFIVIVSHSLMFI